MLRQEHCFPLTLLQIDWHDLGNYSDRNYLTENNKL